MPCLLALIGFFFPRVVLLLLYLFTDYLKTGFANVAWMWPVVGFICMPITTLAYAFSINQHGSIDGVYIVLIVIAVLLDIGVLGSGNKARQSRE